MSIYEGEILSKIIDTIRQNKLGAAILGLIGVLIFIGDVGGGLSTLTNLRDSMFEAKDQRPEYKLRLAKLDFNTALQKETDEKGRNLLVSAFAIVRNENDFPIYITVDRADANLGTAECNKDSPSWPIAQVSKGVPVRIDACKIENAAKLGENIVGRIDWALKYGLDKKNLDQVIRIKGQLVLRYDDDGSVSILWGADEDSDMPVGTSGMLS
ncbi:MAG: hypothetical protein AAGE37_10720 [Pseudomonadota bacterium]